MIMSKAKLNGSRIVGKRKGLRTIEVECPAWADGVTVLREPRVRDYINASSAKDNYDKTVMLLGAMVLGEDGKPVGQEAILDAPMVAISQLAEHLPGMMGENDSGPLPQNSPSDTA